MQIRNALFTLMTAAALTSPALADGFSASLDVPVVDNGAFAPSIGVALAYSLEVAPRIFVGATAKIGFDPQAATTPVNNQFSLGARVGAKYVLSVTKSANLFVDVPVGVGIDIGILPGDVSVGADLNAAVNVVYALNPTAKIIAQGGGLVGYTFTAGGGFKYNLFADAGVFFEPITNLEVYARGNLNYSGALGYEVIGGLYYTVVPQAKVGLYLGYNGGFVVGIRGLFVEKPGTLGVIGAFQP
jgi:hypothetical protein